VLVPELVVRHWWENLMHNRRADLLKVMLLMRGNRATSWSSTFPGIWIYLRHWRRI
jgi:hypothetical protein